MAGSSSFNRMTKFGILLAVSIAILALGGCGRGNGPQSFPNEPAPPLPPTGGGPPFDSGLLTNGDFENGVEPWIGNAANVQLDGDNFVNFADVASAGQSFDVNLSQVVAITEGETYTLSFKARSNRDRTILAGIGLNEEPWTNITETVNLTPDWQTFQYDITAAGFGIPNSRVLFDMGADTGQVIIDDVSLFVEGGGPGAGTPIDPDVALYRTEGGADLVIPDDYAERTGFGSGSIIEDYVDDDAYSPVLSVFSGSGYGANMAQVGFIGFRPGFLGAYESIDFKVRGMPNFVIFVKLFDGIDAIRINLTSSAFSEDLGNGWYQVSIPVARFANVGIATGIVFESDNTSPTQFRMLLTDIGFSGTGANPPEVPDSGIMPAAVVYASDPNVVEDLVPPGGIQNFGSGAVFDESYAGDFDFNPALQVTSGEGYGAGVHVGFAAFTGYTAGFASNYETLYFKVKADAANLAAFEVKLIGNGDTSQVYDLTTYAGATDLGAGWLQVSIPMTDFAATVAGNDGFLLGPAGDQGAAFSFLMTDIGFSGTLLDPGITPDAVAYSGNAGVAEDLGPPGGIQNFGSGAVFTDILDDPDFDKVLQTASGEGYGPGVHVGFAAFTGYAAGFAAGYETFHFKVKGDAANLGAFEVKFIGNGDTSQVYDLASYSGVTSLGKGWLQVSIPVADFAATVAGNDGFLLGPLGDQGAAFSFLMTDIGFSGTAGVDPGITPQAVAYSGNTGVVEDLGPPGGIQNFGSGAVFIDIVDDPDFDKVLQTTSGEGYGAGVHVGFAAFTGYAAGFATGYETFHFKVKGDAANLGAFEVKFIGNGDTSQVYDLGSYGGVTSLGQGWLQVSIPMTDFAATVAGNDGFLLGPLGDQGAAFSFLMTDIGFSAAGVDPGVTPQAVAYASDLATVEDLGPPGGIQNFGSGAAFVDILDNPDFDKVLQTTSGEGYGAGVHVGFAAFTGYAAGFAAGYDTFLFKVKGDAANLGAFEVKFIGNGDTSQVYDLESYGGVTDLGEGWLQVSIPITDFAATVAGNDGFLLGPLGDQGAAFSFLMTDIGFSTGGGGG